MLNQWVKTLMGEQPDPVTCQNLIECVQQGDFDRVYSILTTQSNKLSSKAVRDAYRWAIKNDQTLIATFIKENTDVEVEEMSFEKYLSQSASDILEDLKGKSANRRKRYS